MNIVIDPKKIVEELYDRNGLDLVDIIEILMDAKFDIEQVLIKILEKTDDDLVQASIIDYFYGICREDVVSVIRDKINSDSWLVRAYAIVFLGDIKDTISKTIIRDKISSSEEEELPRIYYALIKFGDDKYLDKLINLLDYDYYRVRIATANLLNELIDDKNKKKILNALKNRLSVEKEHSVVDSIERIVDSMISVKASPYFHVV